MADWREYLEGDPADGPGNNGGNFDPPPWRDWFALAGVPILIIVGLVAGYMSYYTVEAGHVGVVTRFGKYINEVQPGLQFKVPFGIDQVYKVPVERRQKMEFGFQTTQAGVQTEYARASNSLLATSSMLTGDQNIAVVEWVVQYRIRDARAYLFNTREPEDTLRDAAEAAMRQIVGDRSVNELFTTGRGEVASEARRVLQEIINEYHTGIAVVTVELQDISPPKPVAPAFDAVNQAQQERDQKKNEGMRAYQQAIPQAEGEARQRLAAAEGYKVQRINRAAGEVAEFQAVYSEYKKAPRIMRQRMYLEMAETVLPQVKNKYVLDKTGGTLPLLNLGKGLVK